jgi:acetyl-CoA synthetase
LKTVYLFTFACKAGYIKNMQEPTSYSPPIAFQHSAHIQIDTLLKMQNDAQQDRLTYWAEEAKQLVWTKQFQNILDWKLPHARWFYDGELNITDTLLKRHLDEGRAQHPALVWESENGDVRTLNYEELSAQVCRFAQALQNQGISKGDRVAIYMPLIPEAVIAMLSCAHLGAIHSVVFGGFSAEALRDRIIDAQCKAVITADGGFRRGSLVALKNTVDEALADAATACVKKVIVVRHTYSKISWTASRDSWFHEVIEDKDVSFSSIPVDAEHPLFILYTSGTTGKPKGVVHSTAGYLTQVSHSARVVLDLKTSDRYWCSADVGWITGHSYVVYGPLSVGATIFLYEGAPLYPTPDRFWQMIARHRISVFYTAPTAIRTFMRQGDYHITTHNLSSLRLLGSVGEPINPEAWRWYHSIIGGGRCPIVDTWWQTETGSIMMSPIPGVTNTKPGSCMMPLPGIDMDVVDAQGQTVQNGEQGLLVIKTPWPSMMRGIWGDNERFQQTYWCQLPGYYFTGDGARRDLDGHFWIIGRVDDVVNVSGHRIGTAEIESALVLHPSVAEAAAVAKPHDIKGQALVVFVVLKKNCLPSLSLNDDLLQQVAKEIGSFAKPDQLRFVDALPKTRSGKIMRRLLRELATKGRIDGDTSTLEDLNVVATLAQEE